MLTAIIRSCTGGEARTPDKYTSNGRTYFIKKVAYNICKS